MKHLGLVIKNEHIKESILSKIDMTNFLEKNVKESLQLVILWAPVLIKTYLKSSSNNKQLTLLPVK